MRAGYGRLAPRSPVRGGFVLGGWVLAALAACGQTGPLYLPDDADATVITRPAGATSPSAPSVPAPSMPAPPAPPPPARRPPGRPARALPRPPPPAPPSGSADPDSATPAEDTARDRAETSRGRG